MKTLLFIPTYNESENVTLLCQDLLKLNLPIDILFIDDNSPDGCGAILDDISRIYSNIKVFHRVQKQGIGSAHLYGISYAYQNGYDIVMSMDADFTHRPEYIKRLYDLSDSADVVIASRHMLNNSLPGWNLFRKIMTRLGHFLTSMLLRMQYDATGALRLYRIDRIPKIAFDLVNSKGYAFFFESLYVLYMNGFKIYETPIELPARTYGSSKMNLAEIKNSVFLLFNLYFDRLFNPAKFQLGRPLNVNEIDKSLYDQQGWEHYWDIKKNGWGKIYDIVANIYRRMFIRPSLNRAVKKYFKCGDILLHAGCGGGQVDAHIRDYANIVPLDISVNALNLYRLLNGNVKVVHGSIFNLPFEDASFDGVYNLGVMEHFTEAEIEKILAEFNRVLKKDGKLLLFWPPEFGLSVSFFKVLKKIIVTFTQKKSIRFHPDELTRIKSREHVTRLLKISGFVLFDYYFGCRDMFTQVVIVAYKLQASEGDDLKKLST